MIRHTHEIETNLGIVIASCDGHCAGYCDRPMASDPNTGNNGECPGCGDSFN